MIVLEVRNVHEALPKALELLHTRGVLRTSRNGDVLQAPEPVATVYQNPCERVMFHPWRDDNPFFHFYESLWMLAGRNDVTPLTRYVKRMASFSDNGKTFNAAYGWRWRSASDNGRSWRGDEIYDQYEGSPDTDQLALIADALRANRDDRQQVLQIWDHRLDLSTPTKDHACNLTATFQVGIDGRLHMVVLCRSNDIVWGCYGANAVHFSMVLEYMALRSGYPVGTYTQVSVNWHGYVETLKPLLDHQYENWANSYCTFTADPSMNVHPYPIASAGSDFSYWDYDCRNFIRADGRAPTTLRDGCDKFWVDVALPIVKAHDAYKDSIGFEGINRARGELLNCQATDWRLACLMWLRRRELAWQRAHDDGPADAGP